MLLKMLSRAGVNSPAASTQDFLTQDSGFGVSQRMEQARLKHSQEENLARAIEQLQSVSRAKVILALPKENVFARNTSQPSATVVINTRRGGLGQGEVDAILSWYSKKKPNTAPRLIRFYRLFSGLIISPPKWT